VNNIVNSVVNNVVNNVANNVANHGANPRAPTGSHPGKTRLLAGPSAVFLGALFMSWPALFNRYPLLYPDSMTYLGDGRLVARALFLHQPSEYYGMRSLIYALGILPWHWNVTPWPVVAFQSLLTAYVLWLVVRSILPQRAETHYLILLALLSLFTSLSWYSSVIMPDILGPVLYLCIYLLVFAQDALTRLDHVSVVLISWWAVASHATHLMLAVGLCVLLALLLVLRRQFMQSRWKAVGGIAITILLAAAAQVALNSYLTGEPSLNGDRPPFLMARVIADGPGRWYLEQHCGQVKFAICDHVHNLSTDPDNFLWAPDGIWQNSDDDYAQRLRQEEMPFVLATLRAYPLQQLAKSAIAFWKQLIAFGLYDLDASVVILGDIDSDLPGQRPRYLRSREAQNTLPLQFFSSVQNWVVGISLVVAGAFIPRFWRNMSARLLGVTLVIVSTVIANALVTGPLSMVEDRFQSRIIWLLPFLLGLFVLDWLEGKQVHRLA
jgi:hypothetical protein